MIKNTNTVLGGLDMRKNLFCAFLAIIAMGLLGCGSGGVSSELGPNIAEGKTAVASSDESDALSAKKAVDGYVQTRWGSNFFTDKNPDDAWIYIDLGQKSPIGTVVLTWEAAYGKKFNILVSDDAKSWKAVHEEKNGNAGEMVIKLASPAEGRYVKMQGVERGLKYGYSLFEFAVYSK